MSGAPAGWGPLLAAIPGSHDNYVQELAERYAEPHRRYHGVAHIDALARLFVEVAGGPRWRQPAEVALAILFHDALYEPGRADNEARSAELARTKLDRRDDIELERVALLIEATAAHGAANTHADPDLAHFVDADIAILGAPAEIYDRYARGVFEEYSPSVSEAQYRLGRRAFLRSQLARPALFHTSWFAERYGPQARENLTRELASWR